MTVLTHGFISRGSDPGNAGNFSRDILVERVTYGHGSDWVELTLTESVGGERHKFNISKRAAEELMTTLDLFLSDGEPQEETTANDPYAPACHIAFDVVG